MSELSLHSLQQQMMSYLIDDESAIAQHVVEHGGISRAARLHIYKNAYQMRLKETIDNDHQMLGMYLGDDLFEQMVSGYITAYPSNNTSLRNFADSLPNFLANHTPFKAYPLISELAHFERLLMVAFDAKDAERFTRNKLLEIPAEQWPSLVFRFHPSVQIASFNFNTVETWMLWRNNQRLTQFRSLSQQEHALINMMLNGDNFAHLCEQLLSQSSEQDISQLALNYLLSWLDDGILTNQ